MKYRYITSETIRSNLFWNGADCDWGGVRFLLRRRSSRVEVT